jgi:hypothetical protein
MLRKPLDHGPNDKLIRTQRPRATTLIGTSPCGGSPLKGAHKELEDELLDARTFALAVAGVVQHSDWVRREPIGKELALIGGRGNASTRHGFPSSSHRRLVSRLPAHQRGAGEDDRTVVPITFRLVWVL